MVNERSAKRLTKARFHFKDRKRSGCLIFFRAAMSFGSRRGYSKALERLKACPFWNSLMLEFHGMTAPSSPTRESHTGYGGRISAKV